MRCSFLIGRYVPSLGAAGFLRAGVDIVVWAYVVLLALGLFGICPRAVASVERLSPQREPATFAEVHADQGLGRVLLSNNGNMLLFEWGRPYLNWSPDISWLGPKAARRLSTYLYQVDLSSSHPRIHYLFYPDADASYWLGDLSPESTQVAVYAISHDSRRVRAGVWNFRDRTLRWFSTPADDNRLDTVTVWISNTEFIYPTKGTGEKFSIGDTESGESVFCAYCSPTWVESTRRGLKVSLPPMEKADREVGSELAVAAVEGNVSVYIRDTRESLALLYRRGSAPPQVLFENSRRGQMPAP